VKQQPKIASLRKRLNQPANPNKHGSQKADFGKAHRKKIRKAASLHLSKLKKREQPMDNTVIFFSYVFLLELSLAK
jgi:hypothetical protein